MKKLFAIVAMLITMTASAEDFFTAPDFASQHEEAREVLVFTKQPCTLKEFDFYQSKVSDMFRVYRPNPPLFEKRVEGCYNPLKASEWSAIAMQNRARGKGPHGLQSAVFMEPGKQYGIHSEGRVIIQFSVAEIKFVSATDYRGRPLPKID